MAIEKIAVNNVWSTVGMQCQFFSGISPISLVRSSTNLSKGLSLLMTSDNSLPFTMLEIADVDAIVATQPYVLYLISTEF